MDYTSSNSFATDAGTAQRMHLQAQAVPTAVSDTDLNGLIWEALAAIKAGGLAPVAFDKTVPATYSQLRDAIAIAVRLQSAAYASAGGTADALTGTYAPVVPALVNGLTLYVRAAFANATATPTFSPNGVAAKTIIKGNNLPLVAGDIAGAGHWIELQYDLTLDKWVFLNPAKGVNALGVGQTFQNMMGSRALGITYTNTTGRPISISVTGSCTISAQMGIMVGGVSQYGTSQVTFGVSNMLGHVAIVPDGATYSAATSVGVGTLQTWLELR